MLAAATTEDLVLILAVIAVVIGSIFVGGRSMVNKVDLFTRRGQSYYSMKDYDKAIGDCLEALKIDPGCGHAMVLAANCFFWKNSFNKAIDFYTQAINANPKDAYSFAWRAEAYCNLQQF